MSTNPQENMASSKGAEEVITGMSDPAKNPSDELASRQATFARRALIRAGWTIPVIIVLEAGLPSKASALFDKSGFSQAPFNLFTRG